MLSADRVFTDSG